MTAVNGGRRRDSGEQTHDGRYRSRFSALFAAQ